MTKEQKDMRENGYMYMYGWGPLLCTWNYRNIVNWVYSNIKFKIKKKHNDRDKLEKRF